MGFKKRPLGDIPWKLNKLELWKPEKFLFVELKKNVEMTGPLPDFPAGGRELLACLSGSWEGLVATTLQGKT